MHNKPKKFIDFIITQKCTYSCKYCSQSKKYGNKKSANRKTINSFYNLLNNIDKDFEITITGGEALLHNDFFEIISKVKNNGFKINLITNLSFNLKRYIQIFELLDNSLLHFDISFHLDEITDFKATLEKLKELILKKPDKTKITFFIPIYNLNKTKEQQIQQIIEIAHKNNIEYSYQKIRDWQNFIQTNADEQKESVYSTLCNAGKDSCIIYEDGSAYRCYSSRFIKSNFIGNINNPNFKLTKKALPCQMRYCTCPKPLCYNQLTNLKDKKTAVLKTAIDILFLPILIIKNRSILTNKIKQKINSLDQNQ